MPHGDASLDAQRDTRDDESAPVLRPAHLVIDVTDLERAATFWSELLRLPVSNRQPNCVDLGALGAGGPVLSLQVTSEQKVGKNRQHLDFAIDPATGGVVAAGSWRAVSVARRRVHCSTPRRRPGRCGVIPTATSFAW